MFNSILFATWFLIGFAPDGEVKTKKEFASKRYCKSALEDKLMRGLPTGEKTKKGVAVRVCYSEICQKNCLVKTFIEFANGIIDEKKSKKWNQKAFDKAMSVETNGKGQGEEMENLKNVWCPMSKESKKPAKLEFKCVSSK